MLNKILGNDIADLKIKLAIEKEKINSSIQRSIYLSQRAKEAEKLVENSFKFLLEKNQFTIKKRLSEAFAPIAAPWKKNSFAACKFDKGILSPTIRIGTKVERRSENSLFEIPELIPFIGADKTVVIQSSDRQGVALLQSLVVRIALLFNHQARFTLLDPAENGAAFPMRRNLLSVRSTEEDLYRTLNEVITDIRRIIETYLDAEVDSFEKLPEEIRSSELFEFIFAANFPDNYDRRTIEALANIARTGTKAGKYLFIHYNSQVEFPRGMSIEDFENAYCVDLDNPAPPKTVCQLEFVPDPAPPQSLQNELFERLKQTQPQEIN